MKNLVIIISAITLLTSCTELTPCKLHKEHQGTANYICKDCRGIK